MKNSTALAIGFLAFILASCGGSPKLESRDVAVDTSYSGGVVSKILVLTLLGDEDHESRVIIERAFAQEMQKAGIEAIAGYTRFDSVDALGANPASFEPSLQELGIESVLFLDPVRLHTDYDPGEYARKRSAYRALGMDYSASVNLLANMAAESIAAKVVMNVGLWRPGADKDLWNSTYDINAPGNYDVDAAREYSAQFAQAVIQDLKSHGFVN